MRPDESTLSPESTMASESTAADRSARRQAGRAKLRKQLDLRAGDALLVVDAQQDFLPSVTEDYSPSASALKCCNGSLYTQASSRPPFAW